MRRILGTLLGLLATCLLATGIAQAREVSVVKIVNFSCSVCRASESQDEPIRAAVQASGGQYVLATMPTGETTYWRELMYYAARAQDPALEPLVRESFYRGSQDMGLPFSDMTQVAVWLAQDLPQRRVDWAALGRSAVTEGLARDALGRALRIIVASGAQKLPSYVFVVDGELRGLLDPDTGSRNGSLVELRQSVLQKIDELSRESR
jgi:hypothetical protein